VTFLAPVTTPGTYEYQVADLLHDPNLNRWTESQLDSYINEARRQLVMDTGCLRTLQPSFVTAGIEQYQFGSVSGAGIISGGANYSGPSVAFSGGGGTGAAATLTQSGGAVNSIVFTNLGSGYTSPPTAIVSDSGAGSGANIQVGVISLNTYDFLGVHVFWGTQRYALDWAPFSLFSSIYRPYAVAAYQRQPAAWAAYGEQSIFVGPTPDQTYATEFDTVVLPTNFAIGDTSTADAIPLRNQDPIKFYAAHLAKFNAQNYGEAETYKNKYRERLLEVCAAYTRRIGSIYAA
jgi:hypothetical protein